MWPCIALVWGQLVPVEGHPSPLRWQLDPIHHLTQLLQYLTGVYPVTVQLRAPALFSPSTMHPHQVPGIEVPPSGHQVIVSFLPHAHFLQLVAGKGLS